jgi:hypothetical protein
LGKFTRLFTPGLVRQICRSLSGFIGPGPVTGLGERFWVNR